MYFKVIKSGTNRKLVNDFLFIIRIVHGVQKSIKALKRQNNNNKNSNNNNSNSNDNAADVKTLHQKHTISCDTI